MELHWHRPKYSMHGDMVELVAPCGRYLIELGMNPSGGYYVSCCDHTQEEGSLKWDASFPTAQEAKDYAEDRVTWEGLWVDNSVFVEPCGDPACAEASCVRHAAERRLEQKLDAVFSEYGC
jgi:hypothetical protein